MLGIVVQNKKLEIEVFNINAQTEPEINEELITALFIQNIEEAVMKYYDYNLSKDVMVYNYEIKILDIKKLEGGLI